MVVGVIVRGKFYTCDFDTNKNIWNDEDKDVSLADERERTNNEP